MTNPNYPHSQIVMTPQNRRSLTDLAGLSLLVFFGFVVLLLAWRELRTPIQTEMPLRGSETGQGAMYAPSPVFGDIAGTKEPLRVEIVSCSDCREPTKEPTTTPGATTPVATKTPQNQFCTPGITMGGEACTKPPPPPPTPTPLPDCFDTVVAPLDRCRWPEGPEVKPWT